MGGREKKKLGCKDPFISIKNPLSGTGFNKDKVRVLLKFSIDEHRMNK